MPPVQLRLLLASCTVVDASPDSDEPLDTLVYVAAEHFNRNFVALVTRSGFQLPVDGCVGTSCVLETR